MTDLNPYTEYSKEELLDMLDHGEEVETGCETCCDECMEEELQLIREVLIDKYSMKRKDLC